MTTHIFFNTEVYGIALVIGCSLIQIIAEQGD